jgi:RNA polymerase sigma factor (sigma-70 family)
MTQVGEEGVSLVPAEPMTAEGFEAFFKSELPILIKLLRFFDATPSEAEDAAQRAMSALVTRLDDGKKAIARPAPWVRRAAMNFFIKERQRERARLPREIKGGHLRLEAYMDDALTALEDEQYIAGLLELLTPIQREVLRRVLEGMSTHEIAEDLGKHDGNIRQHLRNGRLRLMQHPDIAPLASRDPENATPYSVKSLVTISEAPEEEGQ